MQRTLKTLLIGLFFAWPVVLNASPRKPVLEHVKRAVVSIVTFDSQQRPLARGTGFFVDPTRLITNYHVIKNASRAILHTFDGKTYEVEGVIALDPRNDLALLQTAFVPNSGTLTIADEFRAEGQQVMMVSLQTDSFQISAGITHSLWFIEGAGEYLRITAKIRAGNSGSPVVNQRGEVVGVATLHAPRANDLNFAVPAGLIHGLLPGRLQPLRPEVLSQVSNHPQN